MLVNEIQRAVWYFPNVPLKGKDTLHFLSVDPCDRNTDVMPFALAAMG